MKKLILIFSILTTLLVAEEDETYHILYDYSTKTCNPIINEYNNSAQNNIGVIVGIVELTNGVKLTIRSYNQRVVNIALFTDIESCEYYKKGIK